jgi:hypothetical protein
MTRTSIRSLARSLVASESALETAESPGLEQLDRDGETAARSGVPVEVEEVDGSRAASAGSEHPAPAEGDTLSRGPAWQTEFASPEEFYRRFKDVDHLRGRLANEVGQLRRQVGLLERTIRLLTVTADPLERQALVQAAALIHEPKAHASIERMVAIGERAYDEETAHAV